MSSDARGLKSILEGVPTPFWITSMMIATASFFQFGYFFNFGMEFLSTVGATDWLFFIGVAAFPVLIASSFIMELMQAVDKAGKHIKEGSGAWPIVRDTFGSFSLLGMFIILAATLSYRAATPTPMVVLFCGIVTVVLLRRITRGVREGEPVSVERAAAAILMWCLTSFAAGSAYAEVGAGRDCSVSLKGKGDVSFKYMRMVSDGHLVRDGDYRYFIPKDQVKAVKCLKKPEG